MFKYKLDIKRIFLPKEDERRGGWRELHCEELDNLHSSQVIFRMVNWRAQLTNYGSYKFMQNVIWKVWRETTTCEPQVQARR